MKTKIAILLTCYNRKDTTLQSLKSIKSAVAGQADFKIFLVDDGSTDGTGDAVRRFDPNAVVLRSTDNLFWNRGMRLAWDAAVSLQPDFYLWLNDDTILRPNSIRNMLKVYRDAATTKTIVTGRTIDPQSGDVTYGGYKIAEGGMSRLRFRRLTENEVFCDTMNGNCVLFPSIVINDIGINSNHYRHAFGDNDYGLRARKSGYKIIELKIPVAYQERNLKYELSTQFLTLKNWQYVLFHPKGVPIREWFHFCKTHGGFVWPINFLFRYIKMMRKS